MSVVDLPATTAQVEWELVDFGGTLSGVLGGADQRLNRLGNRWKMRVTVPSLRAPEADLWAAKLLSGLRNGVRMRVPEPDAVPISPGSVLVNGAGQAGANLVVDGGRPGTLLRQGKWLSILTGGRRYLHKLAAEVELGAGGAATLPIEPLLRDVPADNAPVELAPPFIEGLLELPPRWTIDPRRLVDGFAFAIQEAR